VSEPSFFSQLVDHLKAGNPINGVTFLGYGVMVCAYLFTGIMLFGFTNRFFTLLGFDIMRIGMVVFATGFLGSPLAWLILTILKTVTKNANN